MGLDGSRGSRIPPADSRGARVDESQRSPLFCPGNVRRKDTDGSARFVLHRRGETMMVRARKVWRAAVVPAFGVGLLSIAPSIAGPGTATAAPAASEWSTTLSGTLPDFSGTTRYASCGDAFVERGANQSAPRLKVLLEPPIVLFPVAWTTEPNEFGSRAVTGAVLHLENPAINTDQDRDWSVTYWCTTDKAKAWLVFG